ncbi:protein FAM53B isoform X1 [Etheostoma spectabile]|uniref:protein FAM53B isoform X1 n=1 Tax=Etheostoma spectabile TaxID=54343 RepID=UPI0013AEF737|nr:protein FAM53B isoform X1 [Etheostoma spectabile]XP_032357337.1 protein FAM53B isoform X1 [Etheostoma spectabile]
MFFAMVIIFKKTLEKKGADDVASKSTDLGPFQAQTMSQGTALFSCGLMETSRWRKLGHSCAIQQRPVGTSLESLWDVLPEVHKSSAHWDWDVGSTSTTITSLLHDLSLTETASSHSTAPPSKRQCRSLSCSDELGSCRSNWRPQGSRVWTTVEKRRCHSGGSVHRGGVGNAQLGFPAMQRSSSFSLPARSNTLLLPCFSQHIPCPSAFTGLTPSSSMILSSKPSAQPLYLSHEQICLPEPREPSPPSSPDSTPELERRGEPGGLARSRSQPCVLNDKKIGVKRRRPDDTQKQRPSLDLAKMTQKLRNFHSLSCPGITGEDSYASSPALPTLKSTAQRDTDDPSANERDLEDVQPQTKEGENVSSDPTIEEVDWAGLCSMRKDVHQLGGELDIEQIERN